METLLPLPAREPLLPDESLASLIRRTSNAMGYETPGRFRALLRDFADVPVHWNHLRSGPVARQVETLLRQPSSSILRATVHNYATRLVLVASSAAPALSCDSKTILKYFRSAHTPICPSCLSEDAQPYERLEWSLRATPTCLQHDCYLTNTCPNCQHKLRTDRSDTAKCRCGFDFRNAHQQRISIAAARLSRRIDQWFHGQALPLHPLPARVVLWWLERLASAVKKLPDWTERTAYAMSIGSAAPTELVAWLAAAAILEGWPQELFRFLDEFQHVPKHLTTATGLTRSFGLLLREAKHLEDLGYSLIADTLREYLTVRYTAGHLTSKACLFSTPRHAILLRRRPWISLTEADEILRFRNGASAVLLGRGILKGVVHAAKSDHRTVGLVTRSSVDGFARDLKTAMSVPEVGESLGLGRNSVLELIRTDLLARSIWTKGGWRVPRASMQQLLVLVRRCRHAGPSSKHWLNIRQATRQFGPAGLNLVRLLFLIRADQVRTRTSDDRGNFRDLLVSAADLKKACPQIQHLRDAEAGFPLCRLSKLLFPDRPIKEGVLKNWITLGLLRASRNGRAWSVSKDEVARFRGEYCLSREAAQLLRIHRKTLSRWVREGVLTTVYGPRSAAGGGFHLLRRPDVVRVRDAIARHHRKWRAHRPAA